MMKTLRKTLCLVHLFLFLGPILPVSAQTWQWALGCGKGAGDDFATIASDKSGNIYMTGFYTGIGVFGDDTLVPWNLGGPNVPVMFCKLDPLGNFQWVKSITGTISSTDAGKVTSNKNINYIYFYGGYSGNVTIGGNNLQNDMGQIFWSKFDPDGNCIWLRHAGGDSFGSYIDDACVDDDGNIFIAGGVYDTATFGTITILPGNYLAKYDADGNFLWARNICNSLYISGIATNGAQLALVGKATKTTPFYFDTILLDPSS